MLMEDLRIEIFMHVGGMMRFGRVVRYVGGETVRSVVLDRDKIAYFTLVRLAEALGYSPDWLWYVLPKHSLSAGLRVISSDKDVNRLVSVVSVIGYVNVYVEGHWNASADRTGKDNAVDGGNGGDDLWSDAGGVNVIGSDGQDRKVRGSDVGSEDDSGEVSRCIVDSSSDERSRDEIPIGMNGQAQMEVEHQVVAKKDLGQNIEREDSGDEVKTGDWNEVAATKKRSRSHASSVRFDPKCDPGDLDFTVGLTFDDKDQFMEAVRGHATYHQADVHFTRCSSKRVEAKCVDGCPWRVHAGWQRSKSEFVVKRSELEHKCINPRANVSELRQLNVGKKDEVSELKKIEKLCEQCFQYGHDKSACRDAPALLLASQPAGSSSFLRYCTDPKDQAVSAERFPGPSSQARLFGLRKKSEVRRGGMRPNISRRQRL